MTAYFSSKQLLPFGIAENNYCVLSYSEYLDSFRTPETIKMLFVYWLL